MLNWIYENINKYLIKPQHDRGIISLWNDPVHVVNIIVGNISKTDTINRSLYYIIDTIIYINLALSLHIYIII